MMPLVPGTITGENHVQDPPGTATVSPELAESIAAWTATSEQEAALIIAA